MKKLATVATLAILTASSVSAEGFYVGAGISHERIKDNGAVSLKSTNAIALIGYDINDMIKSWDETLTSTIENWQNNRPNSWTLTEI